MVGICIVSSPSRVQPSEGREPIAESLNSESLIAEHANTTGEEVQTLFSGWTYLLDLKWWLQVSD
jgi:hypothetical protein